jgi:hypothetical protein
LADTLAIMRGEEVLPSAGGIGNKFRRLLHARRAPRGEAYMRRLASETLGPDHDLIVLSDGDAGAQLQQHGIANRKRVVLMWPDAIGAGWSGVEGTIRNSMASSATLHALNGRRRFFELTPGTLSTVRTRRAIEKMWIGEIGFIVVLLLVAPFLVVWDLARGRT